VLFASSLPVSPEGQTRVCRHSGGVAFSLCRLPDGVLYIPDLTTLTATAQEKAIPEGFSAAFFG
jgi:hypothetical protein